ncbi:MAG: diguanylate cyclase [Microcoleus sp. SM1_3_4]|nr:diguanylate cyclase [Microcoleus sp. SM1_3_4]
MRSLLGLLVAHHDGKPRHWQEWEVEWLSALATQAGIAIEQSQLYEQLKAANQELHRQATVDGLTQVANRRRFDEYLLQEWRRLARHHAPISLIMCDVDFFKRYNDGYGHLAGDDCLKQVAAAIAGALKRPGDLAARYGGEEFAVILPHTDAVGAFCVAEEIRARVFGLQIPHGNSAVNSCVTMSLGVATAVPVPLSAPEELIAAADEALYCAKERGRDRVIQKVIENWELGIEDGA